MERRGVVELDAFERDVEYLAGGCRDLRQDPRGLGFRVQGSGFSLV